MQGLVWQIVGMVLLVGGITGICMHLRHPDVSPPRAAMPASAPAAVVARIEPAGVDAEPVGIWTNVHVTAIIGDANGHFFARINRRLVKVGDTVSGLTVVSISSQKVKVARGSEVREFQVGGGG